MGSQAYICFCLVPVLYGVHNFPYFPYFMMRRYENTTPSVGLVDGIVEDILRALKNMKVRSLYLNLEQT